MAAALGLPRTTVRDWRRQAARPPRTPVRPCPRCGRGCPRFVFTSADYAELLGLYLGDGHICVARRTYRLRVSMDAAWPGVRDDARELLRRCFPDARVGMVGADAGATSILSVYGSHLPCLFPQHGPGKKHERPIVLEVWQEQHVAAAPFAFLKGLLRSDGCRFVNRTGPYAYASYDFSNRSQDILGLFTDACDQVGVTYRRNAERIRVCRRPAVALLDEHVGPKW